MLNFLKGNETDVYKRYLKDMWIMSDDQIENIHNFIQWVFPLNERSEDNQLSLLKSKYEVESLIERNIVPEPITTQDETKKDKHIENLDLEKLIANKDKFLIACVVISVISAIGFFKFGLNFLFAFLPLFFFKRRKP